MHPPRTCILLTHSFPLTGKPYDIRLGAGNVIPGLDEGISTMRSGGLRRLYIPGSLAFPKGLRAAAGR
jgi:peptidylprolyl isomerase